MRKILLLFFLLAYLASAAAQSVGVAPGVVDLGQVERGETETFEVYLTVSGTSEPFQVEPGFDKPMTSNVFSYTGVVEPDSYSEEEIDNWIDFSEDSYRVDPGNTETYTLSDGTGVVAARAMEVSITVPRTAEPGYHAGQIKVNPKFGGSGEGYNARVVGLARTRFAFEVPGDAQRSIELLDVEALRTGEKEVQVLSRFRNSGTVTTELQGGKVKVYRNGDQRGILRYGSVTIPPGETRRVESFYATQPENAGTYKLEGTLSYRTDEVYLGDRFTFTGTPQEEVEVEDPSRQGEEEEESSVPLLLIIAVLGGLGAALYAFGVKPFWIFSGVGALGIGIFIITSELPVYMLLLVLTGIGGIVYMEV